MPTQPRFWLDKERNAKVGETITFRTSDDVAARIKAVCVVENWKSPSAFIRAIVMDRLEGKQDCTRNSQFAHISVEDRQVIIDAADVLNKMAAMLLNGRRKRMA